MPRAGLTADRVVAEAAVVADERGFDGVTAVEVARRFGVRTASLYSHVASSEAIRAGVARLALDELADRVDGAVAGNAGRVGVESMVAAYRGYATDHPGRFAGTLQADPLDAETVRAALRHTELGRRVLRGYGIAGARLDDAVRFLGAALRGCADLVASGAFARSSPDADRAWAGVVRGLDAAFSNWPEAP